MRIICPFCHEPDSAKVTITTSAMVQTYPDGMVYISPPSDTLSMETRVKCVNCAYSDELEQFCRKDLS